jgi:branched-chain amino acid transport system ATP-binding protein
MLRIENPHAYYRGNYALKGVSLEVSQGEIVCLIGSNGAGKTTLLNCISGLHEDRRGVIIFRDQDVSRLQAHELVGLGLVQCPENRQLFGPMTVEENLQMGAYLRSIHMRSSELRREIEKLFEKFPALKSRQKQRAGTLSGGEQQMVAICRSLMSAPKLLMMDEPSLGLAPMVVEEIFGIIRQLQLEGTTILLVEQNAMGALSVSDRAYLIETGRLTASGLSSTLLADKKVRRAYLGYDFKS